MPLDRLPVAPRHRGALAAVDPDAHEVRTTDGGRLGYDRLIVAPARAPCRRRARRDDLPRPDQRRRRRGRAAQARERALFVLPPDIGWPLPIYELALLAAHEFPDGPEIAVVTPEPRPLDVFGPVASDALARLLDRAGIDFIGDTRRRGGRSAARSSPTTAG